MTITKETLDWIKRKNGRAQRRMARRIERKATFSKCYTDPEMELVSLTRPNYYAKARARMIYLVDAQVLREHRRELESDCRRLFPGMKPEDCPLAPALLHLRLRMNS